MVNLGQLLAGKYEIVRLLGEGAFGRVYLAHERLTGREVAIKEPKQDLPSPERDEAIKRLKREAEIGKRLTHQNIVEIFEEVHDQESIYLVKEYLSGGSLQERLKNGPLPTDEALRIAMDIAAALHHLHTDPRDLVHRDVCPSNILLDGEGRAKLGDFGVVQSPIHSADRWEGEPIVHPGNPCYRAPEAAQSRPLRACADIYMLGAVLWEMLTGECYFDHPGDSPSQLGCDIPNWLEEVLVKALADSPDERWQTSEAFLLTLQEQSATRAEARPDLVRKLLGRLTRIIRSPARQITSENICDLKELTSWHAGQETISQLVYSPNGHFLAALCAKEVIVYRVPLLTTVTRLRAPSPIRGIAFQSNGRTLCYADENGRLNCRDLSVVSSLWPSRQGSRTVRVTDSRAIWSFAASSWGEFALGSTNMVFLINRYSSLPHRKITLHHVGPIKNMTYSPRDPLLILGASNGSLYIWGKEKIKPLTRNDGGARREISALTFSPTGDFAASASHDGTVTVWSVKKKAPLNRSDLGFEMRSEFVFRGNRSRINALAFHPSSKLLAASDESGTLLVWEMGFPEPIRRLDLESAIYATAFAPDGTALVFGTGSGFVSIWGHPR